MAEELVPHTPPPGLSPEQRTAYLAIEQRLIESIQKRLSRGVGSCNVCGQTTWLLGSYAGIRSGYVPGEDGDELYPCVPIICRTCGNTQFINLLLIGYSTADYGAITYPIPPKPGANG
ncbi:MAG: hypothetical protein WCB51_06400 [Candidatus Dormiibacterota bacterium]